MMKAHEIMSNPLIWAATQETMDQVARRLADKKISGVPVRDATGHPVGVLTRTDLAFYEAKRFGRLAEEPMGQALVALISRSDAPAGFDLRPKREPIEGWLTPRIYTVDKNASIRSVAREMLRRRVRHLFVRSGNSSQLIGIITTTDLLRHMVRSTRPARSLSRQNGAARSKAFLIPQGGVL